MNSFLLYIRNDCAKCVRKTEFSQELKKSSYIQTKLGENSMDETFYWDLSCHCGEQLVQKDTHQLY